MYEGRREGNKAPEPDSCFITIDGNREISETLLKFYREFFKCEMTSQDFRENRSHKGVFWQIRVFGVKREVPSSW